MAFAEAHDLGHFHLLKLRGRHVEDTAGHASRALQARIVNDHRHAVGRQLNVELQLLQSQVERRLEGRQRVFGKFAGVTAVGDELERVRRRRHAATGAYLAGRDYCAQA